MTDGLAVSVASVIAMLPAPLEPVRQRAWLATMFSLVVLLMLHAGWPRAEKLRTSVFDAGLQAVAVTSLAAMIAIATGSIVHWRHSAENGLRLWVMASVGLSVTRIAVLLTRNRVARRGALATPTLIVGAGMIGKQLARRLAAEPSYGLRPIGFLDAAPLPDPGTSHVVPVLGAPDDLAAAITRTGAQHVILAFSTEPDHALVEMVRQCERLGIQVSLVPRLYESVNQRARLDVVGELPLMSLGSVNPRGWQFAVKHALDRCFSAVGLLVLTPAMLAIGAAVRLTSPGPAVISQRRVGRDGREFGLLKFRTMQQEGCGECMFEPLAGCAPGGVEGADRRTQIGRYLRKYCMDELPQLINVLRGEMSLVGPRPERPEFVERFTGEVDRYYERHRVNSGMTGWAQVNGLRGQTSISDRVRWDNQYIENWSLGLDFRILALTIVAILRGGE